MTGRVHHALRQRCADGHSVGGDAAAVRERDGYVLAGVVDVLGHGHAAHPVAIRALEALHDSLSPDVGATMLRVHAALEGTRGAAVSLVAVRLDDGALAHAAIGNVTTRCISAAKLNGRELLARDGIVGAPDQRTPFATRVRVNTLLLEAPSTVLMYTDGIRSALARSDDMRLRNPDAAVVADVVIADFARGHDDATCLALRYVR